MGRSAKTQIQQLPIETLKRRCDPSRMQQLEEETEPNDASGPVGQKRALEALNFGLDMRYKGYNIFVMGAPGSGKTRMTLQLIQDRAAKEERPNDVCYLFNFDEPHRPKPIYLSPGKGVRLSSRVHRTIAGLARTIYQVLNDEQFLASAEQLSAESEQQQNALFNQLTEMAEKYDLRVEQEKDQFVVVPLADGEPIESGIFDELSGNDQEQITKNVSEFQSESATLVEAHRLHELQMDEKLAALEREAITDLVENGFAPLYKAFAKEDKALKSYFDGMKEHLLDNARELLKLIREFDEEDASMLMEEPEDLPLPYQVNVMVDHKKGKGAPIEVEKEPTLSHVFGYLEYRETDEGLGTDHMMLHAGSMHRANGGYLILQAADLIRAPEVWSSLKRAFRHQEIRLHDFSLEPDKPRIHGSLRPYGVKWDLKLLLIGTAESYYRLMTEDEDFDRIFKIRAEFEAWMPRDETHELEYARFLKRVCKEEKLLPLEDSALARMIEESSREVESQRRMSTSVTAGIDLLCEANYWCKQEKRKSIAAEDVERALQFRDYRHESIARNIIEAIDRGELLIDTDGWEIGQVNGLLVYISQDYQFGVPTKITARTYVGDDGIINIDREAQLSGAIHDKGSMILVGLVGGLWGHNVPLAFNASITFEQIYGDIEGDSASCAEFYAVLSSLSQVPINQGIAVTGSINQQGLLQPIGAVNAKIEGMFTICKMRGLTGRQGVIIPIQNVNHLMLKDEVIDAVAAGQFHIWPISHVDEGVGILMDAASLALRGTSKPDGRVDGIEKAAKKTNGKKKPDAAECQAEVYRLVEERILAFHKSSLKR